jgi:hypothetical protein
MGKLSAMFVKTAKPGRHADGDGLYLMVRPSGAKYWVLRAQEGGRRRDFGLGSLATLPLAAARDKARETLKEVRAGGDPTAARRARREIPTFEKAAELCHADLKGPWHERHALNWLASLDKHVNPGIGRIRVDRLDAHDIAKALRPAWLAVPSTARRLLQRIGVVMDYCNAMKWRTADNPVRSVRFLLPKLKIESAHFTAVA